MSHFVIMDCKGGATLSTEYKQGCMFNRSWKYTHYDDAIFPTIMDAENFIVANGLFPYQLFIKEIEVNPKIDWDAPIYMGKDWLRYSKPFVSAEKVTILNGNSHIIKCVSEDGWEQVYPVDDYGKSNTHEMFTNIKPIPKINWTKPLKFKDDLAIGRVLTSYKVNDATIYVVYANFKGFDAVHTIFYDQNGTIQADLTNSATVNIFFEKAPIQAY